MTDLQVSRGEVDEMYQARKNIVSESMPIIVDATDPQDAEIERKIRIEIAVFQEADRHSTIMAQVAMRALWEVHSQYDGAYQLVFGVLNLRELIRKVLGSGENLDYTIDIIERVLPHVSKFDDPLSETESKKLDPVEIIETPGLIGKMKAASFHFLDAIENGNEQKQSEIIQTVMTESQLAVRALIRTYNTPKIVIPCRVEEYEEDGEWYYRPTFPRLTRRQWQVMKAQMGNILSIT